jgi:hypothetical protein
MFIEFIKYCPWSFGNRVVKFQKGVRKDIPDKDALEMIAHDYAIAAKTDRQQKEDVEAALTERYDSYVNNFSLNGLKEFCKIHKIPIPSSHKTRPLIIEQILIFEEKHGQITWSIEK